MSLRSRVAPRPLGARRGADRAGAGRPVLDDPADADLHLRAARARGRPAARPYRAVLHLPRVVLRGRRLHGGHPRGALRAADRRRGARRDPRRHAAGRRLRRRGAHARRLFHPDHHRARLHHLGRGLSLGLVHRRRQRHHQRAAALGRRRHRRVADRLLLLGARRRAGVRGSAIACSSARRSGCRCAASRRARAACAASAIAPPCISTRRS